MQQKVVRQNREQRPRFLKRDGVQGCGTGQKKDHRMKQSCSTKEDETSSSSLPEKGESGKNTKEKPVSRYR